MSVRVSKTALVMAAALFYLLLVYNDVVMYEANAAFVRGVLSMEYAADAQVWRAIADPGIQEAFYWVTIFWKALAFLYCAWGALAMWASRHASRVDFYRAKDKAVTGMTLGLLLWLLAYLTVGGEWFLMTQSETWNGGPEAFRTLAAFAILLTYLAQPDPKVGEEAPST
ncbi:MAG: DUF2165 domain-containing protein [Trueperaceae bacterium]|nr:DUF2165 domain-containing protein [Trueperaceae bacterium]